MHSSRKYAPILKWKAGEKAALEKLTETQKSSIIPVIEIIDYEDPHKIFTELEYSLSDHPAYLDTAYSDDEDAILLKSLLELSSERTLKLYPVLLIEDFPTLADQIYKLTDRILIRIPVPEDIEDGDYDTAFNVISNWITGKNLSIDIMLDLHFMPDKQQVNLKFSELKSVLNQHIIGSTFLNNIFIASTSCPDNLASLSPGEDIFVDRYEFKIFSKIYTDPAFTGIRSRLILSDYGVTRFTDTEIDFSRLKYGILPKARYTLNDKYWVLKGKKDSKTRKLIRSHKDIAADIYRSEHYYKEGFSYGDFEIKEIALISARGPGNNTTWVIISANHHIVVVVEQLAKLFAT
ncbi:MAG: hypothetical protein JWM44_1994 [Bacilli bacterium]|nr:hypothetical protein [Bacilli bacterium]